MTYNPQRPERRSPRLKGYDYSQEGAYFVTICTQHRVSLFGAVANTEMQINAAGQMITDCWERLPTKYPAVELDLYCVMPNHFHGIIVIMRDHGAGKMGAHVGAPLQDASGLVGVDPHVRPIPANNEQGEHTDTLSAIMQWFKTMTTNAYMRGVREQNWESFQGKLWQRSFHDHIIRSETSLNALREYTQQNPARWETDEFY
jgi:putative transposase